MSLFCSVTFIGRPIQIFLASHTLNGGLAQDLDILLLDAEKAFDLTIDSITLFTVKNYTEHFLTNSKRKEFTLSSLTVHLTVYLL